MERLLSLRNECEDEERDVHKDCAYAVPEHLLKLFQLENQTPRDPPCRTKNTERAAKKTDRTFILRTDWIGANPEKLSLEKFRGQD